MSRKSYGGDLLKKDVSFVNIEEPFLWINMGVGERFVLSVHTVALFIHQVMKNLTVPYSCLTVSVVKLQHMFCSARESVFSNRSLLSPICFLNLSTFSIFVP